MQAIDESVSTLRMNKKPTHNNDLLRSQAEGILAKAIPEAIWDTNLATGETYFNDALLSIFGYLPEAVSDNGKWWEANLHPADRQRVMDNIAKALESDAAQWADVYQFRCSNGSYKTVADRSTIIRAANGEPLRLVGTMLDITESTERERALTEALQRYNVLMQATRDAIWDTSLVTGETYTNDTLREIFGYDEELKDNDAWWNANLHPADRDRVVAGINEAMASGKDIWRDEYRFRCKNGSYKIVLDRSTIIRNEKGEPVRLIGAMQDITSERILQQALTTQAITKHRETAKGLLQVQEQEKQMLGNELHENISQVLATAKLFIDCAIENKPNRENLLKESSHYLQSVISEIRKLHRDLVPLPLESFTLKNLIQQEADGLLLRHGIKTTLKFSNVDERLLDAELRLALFRIVQEQLENIEMHAKASDALIKLSHKGNLLGLIIADNGAGAANANGLVTGIGFKNIQSRVQVYGGICKVETEKNRGFRLNISIPLAGK
jgi:two-component system, NarL family, sensor histidine kinase UhpB